jgi:hypothetical protein
MNINVGVSAPFHLITSLRENSEAPPEVTFQSRRLTAHPHSVPWFCALHRTAEEGAACSGPPPPRKASEAAKLIQANKHEAAAAAAGEVPPYPQPHGCCESTNTKLPPSPENPKKSRSHTMRVEIISAPIFGSLHGNHLFFQAEQCRKLQTHRTNPRCCPRT